MFDKSCASGAALLAAALFAATVARAQTVPAPAEIEVTATRIPELPNRVPAYMGSVPAKRGVTP